MKRSPAPRRASFAGFTLIELLVVVAIIGLLISILLPSLKRARDQAVQLVDATNLRSVGQAAYLYAQSNRDLLVRGESDFMHITASLLPGLGYDGLVRDLWNSKNVDQNEKLRDLCGTFEVLQCPRFPKPNQTFDYVVNAFDFPYEMRAGEGPGRRIGDGPQTVGRRSEQEFIGLDDLGQMRAAERIYITEAHQEMPTGRRQWGTFLDLFIARHMPLAVEPRVANDQRHPAGLNALFFDSHVQTMSIFRMDPGWPAEAADRVRWFTELAEDGGSG
jgi:prepilin-type N-terminal cleavage/methylation domain-containing protein/prepilin-type processing-associated H-X9-DG protein